jgi:hypothetical protein
MIRMYGTCDSYSTETVYESTLLNKFSFWHNLSRVSWNIRWQNHVILAPIGKSLSNRWLR